MRRGLRAPQFEREQKAEQHLEIDATTEDKSKRQKHSALDAGRRFTEGWDIIRRIR